MRLRFSVVLVVELLRAWLAAPLRGRPLQYSPALLGRRSSDKSTFQRLALALIGAYNVAISTLRDLRENHFETARLYGKRLCMINETGRHGGLLNVLKEITYRMERKHQQQSGSFVFRGLMLMATNEEPQSTDTTSGLERRRITVRLPRSATAEETADWQSRGGEAPVLRMSRSPDSFAGC